MFVVSEDLLRYLHHRMFTFDIEALLELKNYPCFPNENLIFSADINVSPAHLHPEACPSLFKA